MDIPARVTDLRAAEYGDNIRVEFTIPKLNTQGLDLTGVKSVELRATAPGAAPATFDVPAAGPGSPGARIIPARPWIGKDVSLAVRASGPKGKASDWSNPSTLHIETPLAQPANLKPENVERGVQLAWQGTAAHYRIFRATGDQKPEQIAESDRPEYLDESTQYEMRYQYFVQAIAGATQQSEVAGPVAITPADVFPPATPAGVSAVPGVGTIELAWERNTEPDFKGYNVYRSVDGGPFQEIAGLIAAPAYSDHQVEAGKKYSYAISAVDLTGHESARSAPQEAAAQ
jgi:hypothetical protein